MAVDGDSPWDDSETCPFCEQQLPDPGAGFVDHLAEEPDCQRAFADWRTRVADDMRGGWPG